MGIHECSVCFHHCRLKEGQRGLCLARRGGADGVECDNYGMLTAVALDPIEKKPIYHYKPGSRILSVGSYGCNLRCPFCQNHSISYSDEAWMAADMGECRYVSPTDLAAIAKREKENGNIGVAFTYNEPMVGYEYVRDAARAVKEAGMDAVLVTNGTATARALDEVLPYIDAMNIDLKAFSDEFYSDLIQGERGMVLDFIERSVRAGCHVELTTLIIPGLNDSEKEMESLSGYVHGLEVRYGHDIPLHITRFFPRYHMTDKKPTEVSSLFNLCGIAKRKLKYVYPGNI